MNINYRMLSSAILTMPRKECLQRINFIENLLRKEKSRKAIEELESLRASLKERVNECQIVKPKFIDRGNGLIREDYKASQPGIISRYRLNGNVKAEIYKMDTHKPTRRNEEIYEIQKMPELEGDRGEFIEEVRDKVERTLKHSLGN